MQIGSADNGGITLNGAITTDGAVTIDGPVTLATGAISVTTADDAITFNHKINGTQTLTLESGTGAITLDGVIGGDAILTGLSVNATDGDTTNTGAIEISDIGDDAAVGVNTGTISIGNAHTSSLTLDGTTYKVDGVTIFEADSGNTILLTGASPTITTTNNNLTFDGGNIVLSTDGTTTINTQLGGNGAGNILIDGTINGTSSQSEALVINGGTGSVQVQGAIGATNPLTTITIGSEGNGTIEVTNIGGGNSGASGAVAIGNTNTGTLTLDGTVYKTGSTQTYTAATGGGNIDITGAATFTTSAAAVEFATSDVDLAANVAITTGTGTDAGTVTFGGALEAANAGTQTPTIDSGAGNVTFSGAIGLTNALGGLNVNATSGDGAGTITFSKDIGDASAGVKGTTAVGNSATAGIVFSEDTYTFDTGATTFTAISSGDFDLTKGAATTFTTVGTAITFTGGEIDLADGSNLVIDTGAWRWRHHDWRNWRYFC